MTDESLSEIVARHARMFADALAKAASTASTEADIRAATERQLGLLEQATGIHVEGRHEYTLAKGHVDSVYSRVLIEYKNPADPSTRLGPTLGSPGSRKVIDQIRSRFYDMKREQGLEMKTLLGFGFDGRMLVRVRYLEDRWLESEPAPFDRHAAERFLWALYNLGRAGRSLTPDGLAREFGADSRNARKAIAAFYRALAVSHPDRPEILFRQWKLMFSQTSEYDVESSNSPFREFAVSCGLETNGLKPAEFLFSIHTYFALLMKLLTAELAAFGHRIPSPIRRLASISGARFQEDLEDLENGGLFRHLRIRNFLEGDLFSWYLDCWTDEIEESVRNVAEAVEEFNPGTLSEDPSQSRDLLKRVYQHLFPRPIRQKLGEFYTPDWLAEMLLDEVGFDGDPDKRLLDPSCGSGTFLVAAIKRVRRWYELHRDECRYDEAGLSRKILESVVGFDLNPLAVMASRANYLNAIRDLPHDEIEIPVYLCDSVLVPSEYRDVLTGDCPVKELKTCVADFKIPTEVTASGRVLASYTECLEIAVRNRYSFEEFLERCDREGVPSSAREAHRTLYSQVSRLAGDGRDGVWSRIIKNSFAPVLHGRYDFVVGNPPWVRWDNLPREYRERSAGVWKQYGLFTLTGHKARLGGAKKDLSMLFVYVCADRYLAPEGRLGFLVTQTLFKTREAGDGFRRFLLGNVDNPWLIPTRVVDLTRLHPFEGATNRTALVEFRRSPDPVRFPVAYEEWWRPRGGRIEEDATSAAVRSGARILEMVAEPMEAARSNSAWLTARPETVGALRRVAGITPVKAHAGVCTWMNGVFWLDEVQPAREGHVWVRNCGAPKRGIRARKPVVIEDGLVFPLLRGRDVHRWCASPSLHILLTQDPESRRGIDAETMRREYSLTLDEFLRHFEAKLRQRPGFKKYFEPAKDPYWTVYNVGTYSLAPFRVVFKELTDFFQCAVVTSVLGGKPPIADSKLRFIQCESADHAHFVCALLNSAPAVLYLYSTALWVQTADYQATDIGRVAIPEYDPRLLVHRGLAEASVRAHEAAATGAGLESSQIEVDRLASELWGLTETDTKAIRDALGDLGYRQSASILRETLDESEDGVREDEEDYPDESDS